MRKTQLLFWLASSILTVVSTAFAAELPDACKSYTPAVVGGPMPPADSDTVVIRWLGNANFEFAYKGKSICSTRILIARRGATTSVSKPRMSPRRKRFSFRTRISIISPILGRLPNRPVHQSSAHQ